MTRVSDTRRVRAAVADGGGAAVPRPGAAARPRRSTPCCRRRAAPARRPAVGRRHPRLRAARAARRSSSRRSATTGRRSRSSPAAGPTRRARSRRQGIPTYLHVPSPGLLRHVPQGRRAAVRLRGPRVRRPRRPADELRAVGDRWSTRCSTRRPRRPTSPICTSCSPAASTTRSRPRWSRPWPRRWPSRACASACCSAPRTCSPRRRSPAGAIVDAASSRRRSRCADTVLLETGPGHATRCADTPVRRDLPRREKRRLLREGRAAEEVRDDARDAEPRPAARRLARASRATPLTAEDPDAAPGSSTVAGRAAAPRRHVHDRPGRRPARPRRARIAELHRDVSRGQHGAAGGLPAPAPPCRAPARRGARRRDVAIVGLGCLLPKARDRRARSGRTSSARSTRSREVPPERWDWRALLRPRPPGPRQDLLEVGRLPRRRAVRPAEATASRPSALPSIEPLQLLALEGRARGAGGRRLPRPRRSTASAPRCILGAGGGVGDLGQRYGIRSGLPLLFGATEVRRRTAWRRLPEWTEDSFPGILLNVAAGRVANRFNLGGVELHRRRRLRVVAGGRATWRRASSRPAPATWCIVGGVDTVQTPFAYLCFSKTQALSPTRPLPPVRRRGRRHRHQRRRRRRWC